MTTEETPQVRLLETTRSKRFYECEGSELAADFAMKMNGTLVPDYERSLRNIYVVEI